MKENTTNAFLSGMLGLGAKIRSLVGTVQLSTLEVVAWTAEFCSLGGFLQCSG